MARRPPQSPARSGLPADKVEIATYVGSLEHKVRRWWGGLPAAHIGSDGKATRPRRQQTTICPLTEIVERDRATLWVRSAILAGQIRYYEADKDFPKHIWYKDQTGQLWFGYCINSVLGQYKGWPIEEDERLAIFR